MATIPTNEQVQDLILDKIRKSGRPSAPDTIAFQVVQMQLALTPHRVNAAAYETAVNSLIEAGMLSYEAGSSFVKITEAGFARL